MALRSIHEDWLNHFRRGITPPFSSRVDREPFPDLPGNVRIAQIVLIGDLKGKD